MENSLPLRKCQYYGLEARSIEDLESFTKAKKYLYGRRNICKPCFAKILRKGGKYNEGHKKAYKNWHKKNKERTKLYALKRITFKNIEGITRIHTNNIPRTGICSQCGELGITHIHHDKYDFENPLENTRELCRSCHTTISDENRRIKIKNGERTGWNIP